MHLTASRRAAPAAHQPEIEAMSEAAEAVINDWCLWESLKASKGSPAPDSEIATGFWRLPNGIAGTALPFASWSDDGFWLVSINGADAIDRDCRAEWSDFLARTWPKLVAVEHAAYQTAIDTGVWPDGTPVKKERGGMGDNAPPEGSVEALLAEAAGHLESAKNLIKAGAAKSEEDADVASNFAKTLTETKAKIEDAHKVEKKPHLDAGRAVDNKFLPIADALKKATASIKSDVINPFQLEQRTLREEEAARKRAEAEAAAAAGREAEPPPSEPEKVSSGSRGRKTSLVERRYGEITDYEAFAGFLGKMKSPVILAALDTAANALARNHAVGEEPAPGIVIRSRMVTV
jgi:hypothetical protein